MQSNLNFEPSFVRICQVLIEIWPFEQKFEIKILVNLNFWRYQTFQQTADKTCTVCLRFHLAEITKFSRKLVQTSQKNSQP